MQDFVMSALGAGLMSNVVDHQFALSLMPLSLAMEAALLGSFFLSAIAAVDDNVDSRAVMWLFGYSIRCYF